MLFPVFTLSQNNSKNEREVRDTSSLPYSVPILSTPDSLFTSYTIIHLYFREPTNPLRRTLFFMPLLSPSHLYQNTAKIIFRIINLQLHLFNLNEDTEMNHIYVFVTIRYFTVSVLFIKPVRQKVELSLMEKLHNML